MMQAIVPIHHSKFTILHSARGYLCLVMLLCAVPAMAKANPDQLFANLIEAPKTCALNQAFAGLWLKQNLDEANTRLEAAWSEALGDAVALTPTLANEKFKWQMRTWVRIYYLFGPNAKRHFGRLSEANTQRIESLLWHYAVAKSTLARADLKYLGFIQGSENHDMMDLGNAFLAVQALADHPDYGARTLPDGGTPQQHADAWTTYLTRYCEQRFRQGGMIEFASPTYGKYFIPELVNLFDFAHDETLRGRAEALLNLIWADWAIEQLDGIRGGAKARCYQGDYAQSGERDAWLLMGQLLLRTGDWADAKRYNHPILGYGPVLASSGYSLPPIVSQLALNPQARGEYAYISRRPARMAHLDVLPAFGDHSCWYNLAADDARLIRYSWCTPDYIMGSYTIDPALDVDFNMHPDEPERADRHYAAITGQNLWQGIIFNTGPGARIFPQCIGKPDKNKPEVSITYLQQVAVQHENVTLVQANRAQPDLTAIEVYFGSGMKERLVEQDGWRILEEGNSYAAVKILSRTEPGQPDAATWRDEHFLTASDRHAPLIFVTGRKLSFPTIDAFVEYLGQHKVALDVGKLTYTFIDADAQETRLSLNLEEARLPELNGTPVDLAPARANDSPWLKSGDTPGEAVVNFGDERLELNTNLQRSVL